VSAFMRGTGRGGRRVAPKKCRGGVQAPLIETNLMQLKGSAGNRLVPKIVLFLLSLWDENLQITKNKKGELSCP